jgi:hypothetical protein
MNYRPTAHYLQYFLLGKKDSLGVELKIPADGELGSMLDSCAVLVGVAPP